MSQCWAMYANTLQHTATHCNTLQHNDVAYAGSTCHSAGRCIANTLQHTATHCSTLQHNDVAYAGSTCHRAGRCMCRNEASKIFKLNNVTATTEVCAVSHDSHSFCVFCMYIYVFVYIRACANTHTHIHTVMYISMAGSTCHGAGRCMSRKEASRNYNLQTVKEHTEV